MTDSDNRNCLGEGMEYRYDEMFYEGGKNQLMLYKFSAE